MKAKKDNAVRYIRIQSDAEERVEDYSKFSVSIFSEVYSQVQGVISSIVAEKGKRHGDVISLIGGRGSGKTSVMSSVYKAMEEERFTFPMHDRSHVQFSLIERIDASLLDANEDVFDIILARMLNRVEKITKEHRGSEEIGWMDRMSDLLQQFNRIFQHHQRIKYQEKDPSLSQSSLSTLRQFAYSVELAEEFQELTEKYLNLMNGRAMEKLYEKTTHYLVVCIDDLDMNVQRGFQNLERIYRYVAVKNVIVIVAIKYEQMEYQTQRTGHNLFPSIHREFENYDLNYVRTYSQEYLEKLLPIQRRIYMPNIGNRISGQQSHWQIFDDGPEEEGSTVKNSLFRLIQERTGMKFDITTSAPHLLEPASLRELNGYFVFLRKNLEKVTPSFRTEKQSRNCDRFLEDFVQRVAHMKLQRDYYQELLWLCRVGEQELQEQAFDLVGGIQQQKIRERPYLFYNEGRRTPTYLFQHSYGELLKELCEFGTEGQEELLFKEAVLVLYTCMIQKICLLEDGQTKRKRMNLLLGNSWIGSWSNDLVPKIVRQEIEKDKPEDTPSVINAAMQPRLWGCMERINLRNTQIELPWQWGQMDVGDGFYGQPEILRKLEWLCLCFEQFSSEYGEVEPIRLSIEKTGPNGQGAFRFQNAYCNFNILAFVKNSYHWEEYFDQLHRAVADALLRAGWSCDPKDAKRVVSELSVLKQSYKSWAAKSEGIAVPFQYTDIYSRILQRVKSRMQVENRSSISGDEIWDILKELFTQIEKTLREEDNGYRAGTELVDNFESCPFVELVFDRTFNMSDKKWFGDVVSNCANASISSLRLGMTIRSDMLTSDDL